MLTGDMAKAQIQDRIQAAERDRMARPRRVGVSTDRGTARTTIVRKVGSGLLAAVVGPRRKTTPTTAPMRAAR